MHFLWSRFLGLRLRPILAAMCPSSVLLRIERHWAAVGGGDLRLFVVRSGYGMSEPDHNKSSVGSDATLDEDDSPNGLSVLYRGLVFLTNESPPIKTFSWLLCVDDITPGRLILSIFCVSLGLIMRILGLLRQTLLLSITGEVFCRTVSDSLALLVHASSGMKRSDPRFLKTPVISWEPRMLPPVLGYGFYCWSRAYGLVEIERRRRGFNIVLAVKAESREKCGRKSLAVMLRFAEGSSIGATKMLCFLTKLPANSFRMWR